MGYLKFYIIFLGVAWQGLLPPETCGKRQTKSKAPCCKHLWSMYRYQCQCVPQDPAEEEQQSSMWCQKGVDVLLDMPSPSMLLLGGTSPVFPKNHTIYGTNFRLWKRRDTHVGFPSIVLVQRFSNLKEVRSSQTYQIDISSWHHKNKSWRIKLRVLSLLAFLFRQTLELNLSVWPTRATVDAELPPRRKVVRVSWTVLRIPPPRKPSTLLL